MQIPCRLSIFGFVSKPGVVEGIIITDNLKYFHSNEEYNLGINVFIPSPARGGQSKQGLMDIGISENES